MPKVTDCTRSTVALEWIPPLIDGGSKITGYFVEYKEEGKEEWEKVLKCTFYAYNMTTILIKYLFKAYKPFYFLLLILYLFLCRLKTGRLEALSLLFLDSKSLDFTDSE